MSFGKLLKLAHTFFICAKTRAESEGFPEVDEFEKIKKYVGQPGIFFHMSSSDTVWGVNVSTKYNTPIGIYLYPLNSEHYNKLISGSLPFLTGSPYVWIFQVDGNIINSSSYSKSDLLQDVEKLSKKHEKVEELFEQSKIKSSQPHPLSQLFYIIYELSGGIGNASIAKVTNIFKNLGYDGVFDDAGIGIIHPSERIQAVVFSTKNCKPIELVKNKNQ